MEIAPIKTINRTQMTKEAIYNIIKTLDLDKENKLPSEDNLAQLLGVSRITIRSALNELASEGIIFRRQGKGTFVNIEALQMKVQLNPIKEFSEIIKSSGYEVSIKLLDYEIAKVEENIGEQLKIKNNDLVVVIKKIFFADDNPCTYCVDYLPLSFLNGEKDCEELVHYKNSIFKFYKDKCGRDISWDKVEITTTTNICTPELNDIFNCKDSVKSFLVTRGVNFDSEDRPAMYAIEYIDTEFLSFNIIRQKQGKENTGAVSK